MASFFDHVGQKIYESLIEGNKPLKDFSILDAWSYLIEVAKSDKRVVGCVIQVERKGECYNVSQVMVNKRGEVLYSNGEFVVGHIWKVYDLDDTMYEIAKSKKLAKMKLDALKLRVNNKEIEEDE